MTMALDFRSSITRALVFSHAQQHRQPPEILHATFRGVLTSTPGLPLDRSTLPGEGLGTWCDICVAIEEPSSSAPHTAAVSKRLVTLLPRSVNELCYMIGRWMFVLIVVFSLEPPKKICTRKQNSDVHVVENMQTSGSA